MSGAEFGKEGKHRYELEYFPIKKGRAERVRLTLALAGVRWTDTPSTQFGEYKMQKNVLPWGHFPLLKVDGGAAQGGQNLSNSVALQWYICAEEAPELIPSSPLDQHWALSTALTAEDRFVSYVKWAFAPSDVKDSIKKEGVEQTARHAADLARRLGDQEYFATTLSFADITVYDWIDQTDAAFGSKAEVEKFPNLQAWFLRIQQHPNLVAYWKSRPE